MKPFNFANLLGQKPKGSQPTAMEDEDQVDPAAMEDEDETTAEDMTEDEQTSAEDMTDEEEQAAAARKAGVAEGRRAERARIGAIFAAAEPHQIALAASLACNTGMSLAAVKAALATAPKADALAARMAGRNPAPLGAGSGSGGDAGADDETKAARRILANAGRLKER